MTDEDAPRTDADGAGDTDDDRDDELDEPLRHRRASRERRMPERAIPYDDRETR